MRPRDYAGGATAVEDGRWKVDGVVYTRNPRLLLGPGDQAMLMLWRASRGAMGSGGHLPEAVMDQAAKTMDALDLMDAAYEEFRPKRRGE